MLDRGTPSTTNLPLVQETSYPRLFWFSPLVEDLELERRLLFFLSTELVYSQAEKRGAVVLLSLAIWKNCVLD
jgi:hypothetical protein